jgi:hypothetical protein
VILSVLLLDIALLLLPLSFIGGWKMDARANPAIADPVSAKPFMTGVRLTSSDGQQQLFVLQIESLELIGKTLGPFQLEDHRDISANNCYLRSDSDSLSGNLREIEKFFIFMMKSLKNPTPQPLNASPPNIDAKSVTYMDKLVGLPPTLKARPFACAISKPQGIETIFQADLATFDPNQTDMTLEGNVKVKGGNQTCLTAEHIIWRVTPQELNVEGAYRFQTGEREINGQDARFSIAGGGLEPVKLIKTQTLPCLRELPSSAPVAPFMISPRAKGLRSRKKTILSHLSRTLLQNMSATVAPMDQRLTSEKNQGKEGSFSFPKPNVYPAPPSMTYSAEETADRELFCEKSLIKYYKR